MREIGLIGVNFVRTQWVAVMVMLLYMLGIGGVFRMHVQRSDLLFFVRWHAGYAVFVATTIAVPAIQMERKSKRLLAVLSKGIHRWQYIGGVLWGSAMVAATFCALVGLIAWWLAAEGNIVPTGLGGLMISLLVCSIAAAAVGLFFSTFLHPLLTMAATSFFLGAPLAFAVSSGRPPSLIFPVARMGWSLLHFEFRPGGPEMVANVVTALLETVFFWVAAAMVFARRDVTISPE